ncbi:PREDICTED: GTP cyclohydrolase 1 feedback regulatory protein [Chlamydotis macqueenii]|uniref:GTP cyclohydrolase 1 feedback regulatory protein n=1 Tax=Chlamydotis macqueenii TaxID=187382 RepID=UPI000529FB7A|nr:PREDICTED: GTP cyclohydrolase 1 feedback regulatory protein [Chlamydotis macqueenii]
MRRGKASCCSKRTRHHKPWEYYVNDAPRVVLNKLESCGYRVVSMTGVGQTLVWCLHKE